MDANALTAKRKTALPWPARQRIDFRDPRCYQIAVLTSLLLFGIFGLDFGVRAQNAFAIVSGALATQYIATRIWQLPAFDPLSPLITSLSLTLLLRTDSMWLAALAALIAIASKFLIRIRGKHIFNPANVAIVILVLANDHAWVSSGQWGNTAILAFALACTGFLVLTRARRSETSLAFLLIYAALLTVRALWLGDPLAIPLHQLHNGALLVFAFFMISDPKTTPDSRLGRIGFGMIVAGVAFAIRFLMFEPNAPILALVVCSPLVPLIDALRRGETYAWASPAGKRLSNPDTSTTGVQ